MIVLHTLQYASHSCTSRTIPTQTFSLRASSQPHTTYFFTCQQPSPQVIQKIGLIILQVEFILTMITIEKAVSMSHKWLYIEGFIQCKGQFLNKLDIIWKYLDHFLWITCLCYIDIECHPPPFKNTISYTFYSCNIQLSFCITTPCKRKWLQK